jgi:hypothetical protein
MTPFTSFAVSATIMLLVVGQNCYCEKTIHAKEKKVQTPGLWSALECMITDDDITKCVRDHTTGTNGMHINDFPQSHIICTVDLPFLSTSYNFKNLIVRQWQYSYTGQILTILSRLSKSVFCTHKCINKRGLYSIHNGTSH